MTAMGDPPELHEDVDLDLETRRYVLDVHARLEQLTHHELLGVARDADKGAVKRAYFKLARVIHPDRYFGKRLGSFKPKLEAVFGRVTEAYETLGDAARRAEYEASLPAAGGQAPRPAAPMAPEPAVAAPAVPQRPAVAPAEEQARRREQATALAARHAQAAARALAAGDLEAAAHSYREALTLTPDDAALRRAADDAHRQIAERSCAAYRRQAALEEKHGHWADAARSWRRVLQAQPGDLEARARLAAAEARAAGRTDG
jgi:curved DNA-binding protein CbpA